jgi:GNAT superfamily N-acetyltransferase
MRLPRAVRVDYPRPPAALAERWTHLPGLLVATLAGHPIGYAALLLDRLPGAVWVSDLVVDRELRRKGIGSGLLLAAGEWGLSMQCDTLALEMQTKNYPAIRLASKLGFEFCGYNDGYYTHHETGIFFRKLI